MVAQPIAQPATSGNGGAAEMGLVSRNSGPAIPRRLLTVQEAAAYLRVSVWKMRHLVWDGELDQVTIGRKLLLDLQDLDRFIERSKGRHEP